jgi:hypothetical protein
VSLNFEEYLDNVIPPNYQGPWNGMELNLKPSTCARRNKGG